MNPASPAAPTAIPISVRPASAAKFTGDLFLLPLMLPLLPVVGLMWLCSLLQPAAPPPAESRSAA